MISNHPPSVNNPNAPRTAKARRLLAAGLVVAHEDGSYTVRSERDPAVGYIVLPRFRRCSCPDYIHRRAQKGESCAHLLAAELHAEQLLALQRRTAEELAAEAPAAPVTPSKPARYIREVVVKIRRPRISQDAKALEARTRELAEEQARLRRIALCGTQAL
jgi:hypothetical protein